MFFVAGLLVFALIRGYRHDATAVLCAFDLLEFDGKDARRSRSASASWRSCCATRTPTSPSINGDGAIIFKRACALAARASCQSGSAHPTAPAAVTVGSRSRTRPRPP